MFYVHIQDEYRPGIPQGSWDGGMPEFTHGGAQGGAATDVLVLPPRYVPWNDPMNQDVTAAAMMGTTRRRRLRRSSSIYDDDGGDEATADGGAESDDDGEYQGIAVDISRNDDEKEQQPIDDHNHAPGRSLVIGPYDPNLVFVYPANSTGNTTVALVAARLPWKTTKRTAITSGLIAQAASTRSFADARKFAALYGEFAANWTRKLYGWPPPLPPATDDDFGGLAGYVQPAPPPPAILALRSSKVNITELWVVINATQSTAIQVEFNAGDQTIASIALIAGILGVFVVSGRLLVVYRKQRAAERTWASWQRWARVMWRWQSIWIDNWVKAWLLANTVPPDLRPMLDVDHAGYLLKRTKGALMLPVWEANADKLRRTLSASSPLVRRRSSVALAHMRRRSMASMADGQAPSLTLSAFGSTLGLLRPDSQIHMWRTVSAQVLLDSQRTRRSSCPPIITLRTRPTAQLDRLGVDQVDVDMGWVNPRRGSTIDALRAGQAAVKAQRQHDAEEHAALRRQVSAVPATPETPSVTVQRAAVNIDDGDELVVERVIPVQQVPRHEPMMPSQIADATSRRTSVQHMKTRRMSAVLQALGYQQLSTDVAFGRSGICAGPADAHHPQSTTKRRVTTIEPHHAGATWTVAKPVSHQNVQVEVLPTSATQQRPNTTTRGRAGVVQPHRTFSFAPVHLKENYRADEQEGQDDDESTDRQYSAAEPVWIRESRHQHPRHLRISHQHAADDQLRNVAVGDHLRIATAAWSGAAGAHSGMTEADDIPAAGLQIRGIAKEVADHRGKSPIQVQVLDAGGSAAEPVTMAAGESAHQGSVKGLKAMPAAARYQQQGPRLRMKMRPLDPVVPSVLAGGMDDLAATAPRIISAVD